MHGASGVRARQQIGRGGRGASHEYSARMGKLARDARARGKKRRAYNGYAKTASVKGAPPFGAQPQ